MSQAGELTPTEYIGHHLTNRTISLGDGPFWTLHLDTFLTAFVLAVIGFGFLFWVVRGATAGVPNRRQAFVEMLFEFVDDQVKGIFHGSRAFVSPLALTVFVWVFLISGAAPPAHFIGGWRRASSERQPPMYFRLGGGTLKGVSKPGWIVWSRVFVAGGALHCDLGVAEVVQLPEKETQRRWSQTTTQWPIMHTVLKGITRDQMMARHKANHIQVVYTPNERAAHRACRVKAAALAELGLHVHFCGDVDTGTQGT